MVSTEVQSQNTTRVHIMQAFSPNHSPVSRYSYSNLFTFHPWPINLSLDFERKLDHPEETHTGTGRRCKFHITVPPRYKLSDLNLLVRRGLSVGSLHIKPLLGWVLFSYSGFLTHVSLYLLGELVTLSWPQVWL